MIVHCAHDALVSTSELKAHPKNRNKHPKDQIDRLAKILKYQGWRYPIKVSKQSGLITSGHGRLEAAKHLGWDKVPVNYQDYENNEQEYADVQSDNAIASWAELDLSSINSDLEDLGPDFDIDLLGIKDFVIEPVTKYDEATEDEVPSTPKTPRTVPGDIYELGNHRLMCGDSTSIDAVEKLMDGHKADLVFTDPPYGVSYEKKTHQIAKQSKSRVKSTIANDDIPLDDLKDVIKQVFHNINLVLADKSAYYICSPQGGELGLMMMMMHEANIPCRHMIIWVKNAPVFSMGRLDYDYRHEPILFGWSPNRTHHKLMQGDFKNSVWEISREPNKFHPTMKPIKIPENAIKNSCPPKGSVVDFFGGSGSTLIACEKTNRKCFMMELDPHYCDVIVSRFVKFTGQSQVKLNGQEIVWQKNEDEEDPPSTIST